MDSPATNHIAPEPSQPRRSSATMSTSSVVDRLLAQCSRVGRYQTCRLSRQADPCGIYLDDFIEWHFGRPLARVVNGNERNRIEDP